MQPFSRRSSLPQDYESAPPPRASVRPQGNQAHYSQPPVSAIGAPRPRPAPVFHRQAPPAPAYSYDPYSQSAHSHHSQRAPQSVAPPAPHSLAPVEMNAYAGQPRNYQTDRGVAHTSTTNVAPRPTWRTGAMILLAGVFVGGTFGIGVQARRNALDEQANLANAAVNVAPPTQTQQALPPVQQQQAVAPGPTALQPTPPQAPPQAYAQAPANAGLPPGAIVIPPQQGVVVVPPSQGQQPAIASAPAAQQQQQPAQPQAHAQAPVTKKTIAWRAPAPATRPAPAEPKEAKEPKTSGAQIAAKVTAPKKEAAEPADPPEPPAKKGGKKGATDAQSVLQDALRETTNTL